MRIGQLQVAYLIGADNLDKHKLIETQSGKKPTQSGSANFRGMYKHLRGNCVEHPFN